MLDLINDKQDKEIELHKNLAESRLLELVEKYGIKVHNQYMANSGWFDGFKQLEAIIETKSGNLMKLRWMDSNKDFGVKKYGTSMLFEEDLE